MANHLFIIMSNPTPGHEDEYERWYEKHLIETVETHPGFVSGRWFKQADLPGRPVHPYGYVAVYEVAEDALDEAYEYFITRRRDRDVAAREGRSPLLAVPSVMDIEGSMVAFFSQLGPEATRTELS
jgi:hypothetical protein